MACHGEACMLSFMSSTCSHSHTRASINARLASFTSLCMAPYAQHIFISPASHAYNFHFITWHHCVYLQWLAGSKFGEFEKKIFFFKSPLPLPWVVWNCFSKSPWPLPLEMFSKVELLRRSKQERMPRLDCEERQINETAHQLMRSSFVEIVHCGQFCFGDLKSVFGGDLGVGLSAVDPLAHEVHHKGRWCFSEVCACLCVRAIERNTWRN